MALFRFRKGGEGDSPATPHPAESVEMMRRRAKHRLIGAAVLVLIGVVGFPLLFDTQPRPIPVDIPIDIPDRAKVKPLGTPAAAPQVSAAPAAAVPAPAAPVAVAPAPVAAPAPSPAAKVADSASLSPKEEVITAKVEPKVESKPAVVAAPPKVEPKVNKPEAKTEPRAVAKADDGARAKALLEGKVAQAPAPAAAEGRFVVQVGAFADADKAQQTRLKMERAGLKTYTNVAETKDGKRTRVRVGPFSTRAEADKAASKIKGLDLPASILTL